MTHGFEREAFEEYLDTARYYGEQREGLGEEFVQAVEAAVAMIAKDPTRFQSVGDGLRIFRMKRFPYYLFFRFDEERDHATFFAIMHHRRRPGYWRHRASKNGPAT